MSRVRLTHAAWKMMWVRDLAAIVVPKRSAGVTLGRWIWVIITCRRCPAQVRDRSIRTLKARVDVTRSSKQNSGSMRRTYVLQSHLRKACLWNKDSWYTLKAPSQTSQQSDDLCDGGAKIVANFSGSVTMTFLFQIFFWHNVHLLDQRVWNLWCWSGVLE